MRYKYQYSTPEEREQILAENSSLRLTEEQNIIDGNFLILTDEPATLPPTPIEQRISDLEQAMAAILGGAV